MDLLIFIARPVLEIMGTPAGGIFISEKQNSGPNDRKVKNPKFKISTKIAQNY